MSVIRAGGVLHSVEIVNLSENGIGILTTQPIPERGTVQLCAPGVVCAAEFQVVHQRAAGSGWLAGARLQLDARQQESYFGYLAYHTRRSA
ncbi:MAG: hypothetical protein HY319_01890 [Armatimonadetes bacterium]|nr:hypothetical protein [Armatimonadota bacterium]